MGRDDHSPISQEIRYAVVMYGGVSLAIYMNGIAQEMLRLVRSTAMGNPGLLNGTEKIYREIACLLHHGRRPGDGKVSEIPRTRFVIDVLSGTSAGGINAVFLAKALARKSKNLEGLRSLWLKEADVDTLLNDDKSEENGRYPSTRPKRSLFNSRRMYGLLRKAFDGMDETDRIETDMRESADRIDLYVTATDLNGLVVPVELTDKPILERNHRAVFHFQYDTEDGLNDFGKDGNAMLAFAARCTSSFPTAFEPMRFRDIHPTPSPRDISHFRHFFESYHDPGKEGTMTADETDFSQRVYADGGYLDNRPFGYVIDELGERTSNCPVSRKLVFVDPFPEHLESRTVRNDFSFIDNSLLALTELPRYETIRDDLARINNANRLAIRLGDIEKGLFSLDPSGMDLVPPQFRLGYERYVHSSMTDLLNQVGPLFVVEQMLKVSSVSDWLALVVTRQMGFNEKGDYYRIIRLIVRAWREANFTSAAEGGEESPPKDGAQGTAAAGDGGNARVRGTQTLFIFMYDLAFRINRLRYLIHMMDRVSAFTDTEFRSLKEKLAGTSPQEAEELGKISRKAFQKALIPFRKRETDLLVMLLKTKKRLEARERHALPEEETQPLRECVERLRRHFADRHLIRMFFFPDAEQQKTFAASVYQKASGEIDDYFSNLAQVIRTSLGKVTAERARLAEEEKSPHSLDSVIARWLGALWNSYEIVGSVMGRILPHGQTGESGTIDVFRIGPSDTNLTIHAAAEKESKLAGTRFHAFGAFLSEGWRENDILWGRLDGAERLIVSLLPHPADRKLRQSYIRRVREAILAEEFDPENGRIYRWFAGQVRAMGGPWLSEKKLAERIGKDLSEPLASVLAALREHPARWEAFLTAYYDIPGGPTRRQKAEWLSRAVRITGEMIEGLGPLGGLGCKIRLLGWAMVEIVQVSIPGSLRNLWFSHLLCLLMLAGAVLIVLGAFLSADFMRIGLKLLIYASALWLLINCMRSWLCRGRLLRNLLVSIGALLAVAVLFLASLGFAVMMEHVRQASRYLMQYFP